MVDGYDHIEATHWIQTRQLERQGDRNNILHSGVSSLLMMLRDPQLVQLYAETLTIKGIDHEYHTGSPSLPLSGILKPAGHMPSALQS